MYLFLRRTYRVLHLRVNVFVLCSTSARNDENVLLKLNIVDSQLFISVCRGQRINANFIRIGQIEICPLSGIHGFSRLLRMITGRIAASAKKLSTSEIWVDPQLKAITIQLGIKRS